MVSNVSKISVLPFSGSSNSGQLTVCRAAEHSTTINARWPRYYQLVGPQKSGTYKLWYYVYFVPRALNLKDIIEMVYKAFFH